MNSPNRNYPTGYRVPRKNVLLVGCIDLRLMDDLMHFMHHDNLTNRFDQFVLAGASLSNGAKDFPEAFQKKTLDDYEHFKQWRRLLFDHIQLAITLHKIEDIYIIEHQDCGAYQNFLVDGRFSHPADETACHKKFALNLSEHICGHKGFEALHVHCFMIDIRGDVALLHTTHPEKPTLAE